MLEAGPVSGHRHFKHPLQIYEQFLNKLYIHLKKRKKMKKKKTWTIPFFKGQMVDDGIWRMNERVHKHLGLPYRDDEIEAYPIKIEYKDADYTFDGTLSFITMSSTSASGMQFLFEDVDFGDIYPMLAGEFCTNVKKLKDGYLKGTFGFEKIGSRIGIVLKSL